jgi:hypothetical protein
VVFQVEALEVDGFESAVAGLEVEYVRTKAGDGPCRTTCSGSGETMTSVGSMGFSAIAQRPSRTIAPPSSLSLRRRRGLRTAVSNLRWGNCISTDQECHSSEPTQPVLA